jgi:hypothetical protein
MDLFDELSGFEEIHEWPKEKQVEWIKSFLEDRGIEFDANVELLIPVFISLMQRLDSAFGKGVVAGRQIECTREMSCKDCVFSRRKFCARPGEWDFLFCARHAPSNNGYPRAETKCGDFQIRVNRSVYTNENFVETIA